MKKILLLLFPFLVLCGCDRSPHFSDVPYIEFLRIEKVDNGTNRDSEANLVVYFHDGNGDIGLSAADTTGVFAPDSEYHYNFLIDYFEKQNGIWVEVDLPSPGLYARIPYLSYEEHESIEGEITILTLINNPFSTFDTIKLQCRLVDRALNVSNTIETPEIIVRK